MWVFLENLPDYLVLGSATGIVDLIITKTKIFERVRLWIKTKSGFFGELFQCPICLGTWLSFFLVFLLDKIVETNRFGLDGIISWFFLDFIVCLSAGIIYKLFKDSK